MWHSKETCKGAQGAALWVFSGSSSFTAALGRPGFVLLCSLEGWKCGSDLDDSAPWLLMQNELAMLELIHCFVEVLDKHFGQVCELDIMNEPDMVSRRPV